MTSNCQIAAKNAKFQQIKRFSQKKSVKIVHSGKSCPSVPEYSRNSETCSGSTFLAATSTSTVSLATPSVASHQPTLPNYFNICMEFDIENQSPPPKIRISYFFKYNILYLKYFYSLQPFTLQKYLKLKRWQTKSPQPFSTRRNPPKIIAVFHPDEIHPCHFPPKMFSTQPKSTLPQEAFYLIIGMLIWVIIIGMPIYLGVIIIGMPMLCY